MAPPLAVHWRLLPPALMHPMTDTPSRSLPRWQRLGPLTVLIRAGQIWLDKRASSKGAALALYMMFSLAPMLILVVALSGWFFSEELIRNEILRYVDDFIGQRGADVVRTVMSNAHYDGSSQIATLISLAIVAFSATTAFAELKASLDDIWDATPTRSGFRQTVQSRLIAFTVLLALVAFLGFTLLVEAVLALLQTYWPVAALGPYPHWLDGGALSQLVSFGAFVALFAAVLKLLPSLRLSWRAVLPGAFFTAALFWLGKFGIGLYLGSGTLLTAYGAAGSLVALLAWIYFSALIFYFGAAFTRAWYDHYYPADAGPGHRTAPP